MNALKKQADNTQLKCFELAPKKIALFTLFKESRMKLQVCETYPREDPNHLQLIFTKGAFVWASLLLNKQLEFRFQKSTMFKSTQQQYFGSGQFNVEQSMILPNALSHQFNLKSYWIKSGTYSITETETELIVVF